MPERKHKAVHIPNLSSDQRAKFEAQKKKARQIMSAEIKDNGGKSKAYTAANRAFKRADAVLHPPAKKSSPGKPKNSKPKSNARTGVRAVAGIVGAAVKKHQETQAKLKGVQKTSEQSDGGPKGSIRKEDYDRTMGKG